MTAHVLRNVRPVPVGHRVECSCGAAFTHRSRPVAMAMQIEHGVAAHHEGIKRIAS